jgi:hypothetical protein
MMATSGIRSLLVEPTVLPSTCCTTLALYRTMQFREGMSLKLRSSGDNRPVSTIRFTGRIRDLACSARLGLLSSLARRSVADSRSGVSPMSHRRNESGHRSSKCFVMRRAVDAECLAWCVILATSAMRSKPVASVTFALPPDVWPSASGLRPRRNARPCSAL